MPESSWRVGHEYRGQGGFTFEGDELLRWLKTDAGSIANSGGIRYKDAATGAPIDPETGRAVPASFALITTDMSAQHHNLWDDVIDEISGNVVYLGDAKFSARKRSKSSFKGNARLEATDNIRLAGRLSKMPAKPCCQFCPLCFAN